MKKVIANSIMIALMGGLISAPPMVRADTKKPPAAPLVQNTSSNTTFDGYRQECLQRAKRQGLADDIAADLCKCTIDKFQQSYNLGQFRALVQKSKTDKAAARSLTAVGEACFDRVLYE